MDNQKQNKETLGRKITNWGCILFLAAGTLLPDIIDRQPTYNYNSFPIQEQPAFDSVRLQATNGVLQITYNLTEGRLD